MMIWEKAKHVCSLLRGADNQYEALIVGGAVRDFLLNKECDDIDIATNRPMEDIETMFDTVDIGANKTFGILVAKVDGFVFEIAQFRTESGYSDGRHPDELYFVRSFKEDSARRDFTFNAMGMDADGNIVDHHGGVEDLKAGIIRTVDNPFNRFSEDFIRMLRAVRFSSRFGFEIEECTFAAIQYNADKITTTAPERIMKEIMKMAEQPGEKFAEALVMMKETGLLKYIFPELDVMDQFEHDTDHHPEGGVWCHTLAAVRRYKGRDPVVNMSVLFHDVAKPITYSNDETGIHYYYHSNKGEELVNNIADRMKFDNNLRAAMALSARFHMKFHFIAHEKNRKIIQIMNEPQFEVLYEVAYCDTSSRLHAYNPDEWGEVTAKIDHLRSRYGVNPLAELKKVVTGERVMRVAEIPPGKMVGEIIHKVIGKIVDKGVYHTNSSAIDLMITEESPKRK